MNGEQVKRISKTGLYTLESGKGSISKLPEDGVNNYFRVLL